jgi:predicted acyltransferase
MTVPDRAPDQNALPYPTLSHRLKSLDALRGFDMFWIAGSEHVIHSLRKVSDAGAVVFLDTHFLHRDWEGMTFYDLIFPLFLFIVGVSMVFSLDKILAKEGRRAALARVLKRSILLYLLGVIFSSSALTSIEEIRLMGVLQRIAICYLIAAILYSTTRVRVLIIAFAALLVGYWALMTFVPVPGYGPGNFQKGANLANYIDKHYLPLKKYDGEYDPEGLLSTLPALSTCLLGVFAGRLLKNEILKDQEKVRWLLLGGVAGILMGFLWGIQFPVIKKIWTSSYVLVSGGYSCILLAGFYQVIDIWGIRKWSSPFVWIGMNSIAIYLTSGIAGGLIFYSGIVANLTRGLLGEYAELLSSLVYAGVMVLIAYGLFRRKIFIRL